MLSILTRLSRVIFVVFVYQLLNVLRLADVLLFKEPSLLQSRFERKNLQDMFQKVGENFKDLDNRKNYSYVISDDFEGLVWNELPDFWNESSSKSFSKK